MNCDFLYQNGLAVCRCCGFQVPINGSRSIRRRCTAVGNGTARAPSADLAEKLLTAYLLGNATRPAFEADALLRHCRQCHGFTGDACQVYGGCCRFPRFLELLTNAALRCPLWPAMQAPIAAAAAAGPHR